jgi:hypothetical protein
VSPLLMSVIEFVCVLGGTFFGIYLRNRLPWRRTGGLAKGNPIRCDTPQKVCEMYEDQLTGSLHLNACEQIAEWA